MFKPLFRLLEGEASIPWQRFEVAPRSELPHIRRSILQKIESERRRLHGQKLTHDESPPSS